MITYGGVIRDDEYYGYADNNIQYAVNCCGYVKIKTKDIHMTRTRADYYLIYLIGGVGHYRTADCHITAGTGDIVLYRPDEMQNYYYSHSDHPEFYWIHFTGSDAEGLLSELQFSERHILHIGINDEIISLFKKIISELQLKKQLHEEISCTYLLQLIYGIVRLRYCADSDGEYPRNADIEGVMKRMHTDYNKNRTVADYAVNCNLSAYRFCHVFKNNVGVPPMRYVEQLRMEKSKELLSSTSLSVGEISDMVGYSSPFYFSRVFKKNTGKAPSAFRNITIYNKGNV